MRSNRFSPSSTPPYNFFFVEPSMNNTSVFNGTISCKRLLYANWISRVENAASAGRVDHFIKSIQRVKRLYRRLDRETQRQLAVA